MDGTAVNAIASLQAKTSEVVSIGGVEYVITNGGFKAPAHQHVPMPATLQVHTLGALLQYVAANRDAIALDKAVVHVVAPDSVMLLGPLTGHQQQRPVYVEAATYDRFAAYEEFDFARFVPVETMVTALQALFVPSAYRDDLLALLSNVRAEQTQEVLDTGAAQRVVAKAGVEVSKQTVPNPWSLMPYRTFPEVPQPQSPFVLRFRAHGAGIVCALYEADGGAWRDAATEYVAEYLRERALGVPVLA